MDRVERRPARVRPEGRINPVPIKKPRPQAASWTGLRSTVSFLDVLPDACRMWLRRPANSVRHPICCHVTYLSLVLPSCLCHSSSRAA
jgi:hypothetical protein